MKVIRKAAVIVGTIASVVAVVATVTGHPDIAAVATLVATAAGAVAAVSSLLMKRPSDFGGGSQTDFKADVDAGIPYVIGRTLVGGNIVHQDSFGDKRKFQAFVVVGSGCGPIEAIESFKVDRTTVAFNGAGEALGYYGSDGGDRSVLMWLDTQLGASPESTALTPFLGTLPGWNAASKMSGYAAWLWQLRYDVDGDHNYNNGVPKPAAVLKGVKVYDPRLDSTYPGGSGACRPGVESTYVYSENPWLHALTFALGRFQNAKRVMGIGMALAGITTSAYVEAANIADANGWKCGGQIYSTDDKWDRLKAMAQAGGGVPMRLAAQLSCMVNAPRVSLATITAADIVGEASNVTTQSRRDRINGIIPRYRSEAHDWEVVPASVVRVPAYVTADGGERTREVAYPLVQDVTQASELAYYDIANAREQGPITLPLKTKWMGYKPGDCLTVDVPELGLNAQPCIVLTRQLDPSSAIVTLELKTETPAKHSAALGQAGSAPPVPDTSVPDLTILAPAPGSWTITGTSVTSGGVSLPALVITGASDNPNADAVLFEYRIVGATVWNPAAFEAAGTVRKEILGLSPSTNYEVAVSYRVNNVVGARLVLSAATTAASPYIVAGTLGASGVGFTPALGIAATNVQAAIEETYAEKQANNGNLSALAGLSLVADRLPYADGTGTLTLATFTAAGRTAAAAAGTTGTGSLVFSASPSFTGTMAAAAATFSGNVTLGDASTDSHTANGTFAILTGNSSAEFKSRIVNTNTAAGTRTAMMEVLTSTSRLGGTIVATIEGVCVAGGGNDGRMDFYLGNGTTVLKYAELNRSAFAMTGAVTASTWVKPGSYTVATVPSAATAGAGAGIHVSNESGGATNAFSDGTNWRRVHDRAIIS